MSAAGKMQEPSMDDIIRSIRNIIADDAIAPVPAAKPQPEVKPASAAAPVYRLSEQQIATPAAPTPAPAMAAKAVPASPAQPGKLAAAARQPETAAGATAAPVPASLSERIAAASVTAPPTALSAAAAAKPAKPATLPLGNGFGAALAMPPAAALKVGTTEPAGRPGEATASQADIDAVFGGADDEMSADEEGFGAVDFFAADPVAEVMSVEDNERDGRYAANGIDPMSIRDSEAMEAAAAEGETFDVNDLSFGEEPTPAPAEAADLDDATELEAFVAAEPEMETPVIAVAQPEPVQEPVAMAATKAATEAVAAPLAPPVPAAPTSTAPTPTAPILSAPATPAVSAADAMAVTAVASATSKALSGEEGAATKPAQAGAPGGRTLEESVREMLRPMIREWLDANLPRILERAIIEEIDKK
jgi:cell pole-organizing protein PopZ